MVDKSRHQYRLLLLIQDDANAVRLNNISHYLNARVVNSASNPGNVAWQCCIYRTAPAPNADSCDTFQRMMLSSPANNLTNSISYLLTMLVCVLHECPQIFTTDDLQLFDRKLRYYMCIGRCYV